MMLKSLTQPKLLPVIIFIIIIIIIIIIIWNLEPQLSTEAPSAYAATQEPLPENWDVRADRSSHHS